MIHERYVQRNRVDVNDHGPGGRRYRLLVVEIPHALAKLEGPLAERISLVDVADLAEAERAAVPPW
jgi:hypothetical protein